MPWAVVVGDGLALPGGDGVAGPGVAAECGGAGVGVAGATEGVDVVGAGDDAAAFPEPCGVCRWGASRSAAPVTRRTHATTTASFSRPGGMRMAGLRDYPAWPRGRWESKG